MEQGPTTTTRRSFSPCRIPWTAARAAWTTAPARSVQGNSRIKWEGGASSWMAAMRTSSVFQGIRASYPRWAGAPTARASASSGPRRWWRGLQPFPHLTRPGPEALAVAPEQRHLTVVGRELRRLRAGERHRHAPLAVAAVGRAAVDPPEGEALPRQELLEAECAADVLALPLREAVGRHVVGVLAARVLRRQHGKGWPELERRQRAPLLGVELPAQVDAGAALEGEHRLRACLQGLLALARHAAPITRKLVTTSAVVRSLRAATP